MSWLSLIPNLGDGLRKIIVWALITVQLLRTWSWEERSKVGFMGNTLICRHSMQGMSNTTLISDQFMRRWRGGGGKSQARGVWQKFRLLPETIFGTSRDARFCVSTLVDSYLAKACFAALTATPLLICAFIPDSTASNAPKQFSTFFSLLAKPIKPMRQILPANAPKPAPISRL